MLIHINKIDELELKDYEYSQNGAYFITICTHDKECILCEIIGQGLYSCPTIGDIICTLKSITTKKANF